MFTPRIVRPVSNRASQCLRVRLEASPRYCRQQQRYQSSPASRFLLRPRVEYTPIQSIAFQFRQQRYRSTFRQNFTQLYKEYPVSVSAAVFLYFSPAPLASITANMTQVFSAAWEQWSTQTTSTTPTSSAPSTNFLTPSPNNSVKPSTTPTMVPTPNSPSNTTAKPYACPTKSGWILSRTRLWG